MTIDHSANSNHTAISSEEATRRVQVLMSDYFCRGCHQPHGLDKDGLCEFCRPRSPVVKREANRSRRRHFFILTAIGLMALTVLIYGYLMAANA